MRNPRASGSMNDTGGGSKKWGSTELDDEVDERKFALPKKFISIKLIVTHSRGRVPISHYNPSIQ